METTTTTYKGIEIKKSHSGGYPGHTVWYATLPDGRAISSTRDNKSVKKRINKYLQEKSPVL